MSGGLPGPASTRISIPEGDLLSARVVDDVGDPLRDAFDRDLTGYLELEPPSTLLLDGAEHGVLTVADGVPVLAYELDADATGPAALAALAGSEPIRVSTYRLPPDALSTAHGCDALRVAPGAPARELAADHDLAERSRERAPDGRRDAGTEHDALAAFLADEERVDAIKREAREEAKRRAAEWGLGDELADHSRSDATRPDDDVAGAGRPPTDEAAEDGG
ncbi:hypothetical protein [Halorarum salinum]|uniref:DUF8054 domain-containing protein n=1 Tax=Halorarum salinum TaxID=2743089 RepID=A0A7D5Q7S4_9EURY|nr:hypothetical protein [Halobaculum salinum]QLG60437.1 hypothetical protein HUG12_01185 [Halobaculum salinum]